MNGSRSLGARSPGSAAVRIEREPALVVALGRVALVEHDRDRRGELVDVRERGGRAPAGAQRLDEQPLRVVVANVGDGLLRVGELVGARDAGTEHRDGDQDPQRDQSIRPWLISVPALTSIENVRVVRR